MGKKVRNLIEKENKNHVDEDQCAFGAGTDEEFSFHI